MENLARGIGMWGLQAWDIHGRRWHKKVLWGSPRDVDLKTRAGGERYL